MCFGSPRTPAVQRVDPEEQAREAEARASTEAARQRNSTARRRRRNALSTGAGGNTALSLYSGGQQTLGS